MRTVGEREGIAPQVFDAMQWLLDFAAGFDLVGWTHLPDRFTSFRWARTCEPRNNRLMVIAGGWVEADNKRWIHVSYSRPGKMPSYADLVLVKDRFIGAARSAISVHPPKSEHVSLHPYCLHLWHCLDGDGLPDFRHEGQI